MLCTSCPAHDHCIGSRDMSREQYGPLYNSTVASNSMRRFRALITADLLRIVATIKQFIKYSARRITQCQQRICPVFPADNVLRVCLAQARLNLRLHNQVCKLATSNVYKCAKAQQVQACASEAQNKSRERLQNRLSL